MKEPKKKRQYRLDDLLAIAEQLGGRIRIELVPAEMCGVGFVKEPIKMRPKAAKQSAK